MKLNWLSGLSCLALASQALPAAAFPASPAAFMATGSHESTTPVQLRFEYGEEYRPRYREQDRERYRGRYDRDTERYYQDRNRYRYQQRRSRDDDDDDDD